MTAWEGKEEELNMGLMLNCPDGLSLSSVIWEVSPFFGHSHFQYFYWTPYFFLPLYKDIHLTIFSCYPFLVVAVVFKCLFD